MKLKRKAERRRKRRTKGGDLNLSYEKRGSALGGISKARKQPGTPSPGRSTVELFLSTLCDSVGGCVKDASRHMRGLKALVAAREWSAGRTAVHIGGPSSHEPLQRLR